MKTSDSLTEDDQIHPPYDWDEQFEELQSFMSEYGHCNFPQNPSKELEQKYPTLKRFCHDQRTEHRRLQWNKKIKDTKMTLQMFDRDVRCRQLEEVGFVFNRQQAQWYDTYHELLKYANENGHARVGQGENEVLHAWMYYQQARRRGTMKNSLPLSESQIKLLDEIGFQWKSELREQWNVKYKALVAFHQKHGHLLLDFSDPLNTWMNHQRYRRNGGKNTAPLTDEQIDLLDEIDFPWEPERYDLKWHVTYEELRRCQMKHGHCQPSRSIMNESLYMWSLYQQSKHREGLLSTEKIELLEKIGFPLGGNLREWDKMYAELSEYSNTHGHLQVMPDDDPELFDWMSIQRERYHGNAEPPISNNQIEKLEDLHFCWSLDWRDRTWHEKYTEAVEYFKEHGHVRVTKKENPSLYNWIEMQETRYKKTEGKKPLSEEELEMLEQIEFPFLDDGQPRTAWNTMYGALTRYHDENDGHFPAGHTDDPDLNRWIRHQRHRLRCSYGYPPLSDEQKVLLEKIDFPRYPAAAKQSRKWYEKYDELVDFWKQHGHCEADKKEHAVLYTWIKRQRARNQGTLINRPPIPKLQLYLLERIGFTWTSNRSISKKQ